MDPEDPSPYVNPAYLLDTQSTATLSGQTKTSLSSGSNNWARNSPRPVDTRSTWSSDRKSSSPEFGNPSPENCSRDPLGASEKPSSVTLPQCDVVAPPSADDVSASARTPQHRGKSGGRCSEAIKRRTACRTGPSTSRSTHADLSRLVSLDSAAGSHGVRVAFTATNKSHVVQQLSQSLSDTLSGSRKKCMPRQAPGPSRASGIDLSEEATVEGLQSSSSTSTEAGASGRNGMHLGDVRLPVLEKEASFSAGVTAYYADFIDGQLLALWHFTVSPSNREHSAFQYSLSDWKIYDCLRKTESARKASCTANGRDEGRPRNDQFWPCTQREAAGIAYEPRASTHPAAPEAAETTNPGSQQTAASGGTQDAFRTPAFSMRNRGDVWTLLDWKCLSFEPDGDVTVFDFCSPFAKELPKEGDT